MINNPNLPAVILAIFQALIIGIFTGIVFPLTLEWLKNRQTVNLPQGYPGGVALYPLGFIKKMQEVKKQKEEEERQKSMAKRWKVARVSFLVAGVITFLFVFPSSRAYFSRPSGEIIDGPIATSIVEITPTFDEATPPTLEPGDSTAGPRPTITPVRLTPTPTMVSQTQLALLRSDDFSSSDSGWDDYFDVSGSTGYGDGRYFIKAGKNVLFLSVWGSGGTYTKGVFQVEVLSLSGSGIVKQGIGVGWQTGWTNQIYAVTIDSNGTCNVYESTGSGSWLTKVSKSTQGFNKTLDRHVLTLVVDANNKAFIYADSNFCASHVLERYSGGRVGVVALGSNDGGTGYFDNFKVYGAP